MSHAISEPVVPKGGVLAAAALVLFALAAVTTVRLTGMGEVHMTRSSIRGWQQWIGAGL
jgi:hypothetical protein